MVRWYEPEAGVTRWNALLTGRRDRRVLLEQHLGELPLSADDLESILFERRTLCVARSELLGLEHERVDRADEIVDGLGPS